MDAERTQPDAETRSLSPLERLIEEHRDRPAMAALLAWRPEAITGLAWDREELTVVLVRESVGEACRVLRRAGFEWFEDVTCVDWYPSEPRFHVVYHLLSHKLKQRVRLRVELAGDDPVIESITPVWAAANFYEREVFDLFGVRFTGHPDPHRIMMPEDWVGHPLRKDYPVEGFR